MSDLFSDVSMQTVKAALDGLGKRQEVISRNIANVDTPGYQAQAVNFEDTLKKAVAHQTDFALEVTNPLHLASTTTPTAYRATARPGGSTRADGNNVDIDVELADMSETGIEYQALTLSASKKLELLKTIAMSG